MRNRFGDLTLALLMCGFVFEPLEGAEVCYNIIRHQGQTCFSNNPPFDNAFGYLPESPETIATKFFLYTKDGAVEQINLDDVSSSTNLQKRYTIIFIHGYLGGYVGFLPMVAVLLSVGDYNVIGVDWRGGAKRWNYYQCVANTRVVGVQVGHLVKSLEALHQISPGDVHIIGHSLGAHIAGYAGKSVLGLWRISGLDPAGPAFYKNDSIVRLSKSDASYVDVIHTNGGNSWGEGLGLFDAVGHADFDVNGGINQPACLTYTCSHLRAVTFYILTINQTCPFLSYPYEQGSSFQDTCSERGCVRAGYFSLEDGASGLYYTPTSAYYPFCSETNGSL